VVRTGGDVVHAPSLAVPPPGRRPLVVTVHDLAFRTHPDCFPPRGRAFHERGLSLARAEAAAVVVPSEATAAELRSAGFEPARIHVAHHGIDLPPQQPHYPQGVDPGAIALPPQEPHKPQDVAPGAIAGLGPRSYLLFVGTVEPRKGIDVLVAAHAALRRQGHPDLRLVIAGPRGWGEVPGMDRFLDAEGAGGASGGRGVEELGRAAPRGVIAPGRFTTLDAEGTGIFWNDDARGAGGWAGVIAPGRVDEATLDALYRGAAALVMPSRSEGFGLPALEAMARGCPVVASRAGALPEVVGDAGILVPPGDADALAAALDRLLTDDSLAATLAAAGRRRAATFTWSACTAAHLAAYHAALGLPAPAPTTTDRAAAGPGTPTAADRAAAGPAAPTADRPAQAPAVGGAGGTRAKGNGGPVDPS
jgi:glycosyltransferase involved in cell wall biosynthesis